MPNCSLCLTTLPLFPYSESRGEWKTIHPPAKCLQGGVIWLGTFGRVRVWLKFGTDKKKVQEFEFCLTAGSPNRIYIWWDSRTESWSPISFPLKIGQYADSPLL